MTTTAGNEEAQRLYGIAQRETQPIQTGFGEAANAWDRAAYFADQAMEKSAAAVNASLKATAAWRQATDDDSRHDVGAFRRAANASLRAYNASRDAADAAVKAAKASHEAENAMARAANAMEHAASMVSSAE